MVHVGTSATPTHKWRLALLLLLTLLLNTTTVLIAKLEAWCLRSLLAAALWKQRGLYMYAMIYKVTPPPETPTLDGCQQQCCWSTLLLTLAPSGTAAAVDAADKAWSLMLDLKLLLAAALLSVEAMPAVPHYACARWYDMTSWYWRPKHFGVPPFSLAPFRPLLQLLVLILITNI